MSARELVVLGTAGQVPTAARNHNGYLLLWDGDGILFDPGEGTQRQLTFAGVSVSQISKIFLTHFHGDHCLGLPGVLQRMALDGVESVDLWYPAAHEPLLDRLLDVAAGRRSVDVRRHPVASDGVVFEGAFRISAAALKHRETPCFGYRVQEPDGRRLLPDKLAAAGIAGPDVSRLQREGSIEAGGRTVSLDDVSVPRPGQGFAFVMDTATCRGAHLLARGADVLVCESTFLDAESDLATAYGHLTAGQAAKIARAAGAGRLVLTHFSQRHPDQRVYEEEARATFEASVAVRDLDRVSFPPRRPG